MINKQGCESLAFLAEVGQALAPLRFNLMLGGAKVDTEYLAKSERAQDVLYEAATTLKGEGHTPGEVVAWLLSAACVEATEQGLESLIIEAMDWQLAKLRRRMHAAKR